MSVLAHPMAATVRSLAHPSTDPPALVARVRAALGWEGSEFLVGLRGHGEMMATLDVATDLDGLIRCGDVASPPLRLLRALDGSSAGLRLTRVVLIAPPWRWVRPPGVTQETGVAVRRRAFRDVEEALERSGAGFRVLPDDTPTEELLELGRQLGSAVVDVDEVPDGAVAVPGYLEDAPALSYGLLTRADDDALPAGGAAVWLSMAAREESAGTLMAALEQVSALDVDLEFLHSDPQGDGRHHFFVGFRTDADTLDALRAGLGGAGFTTRVLAAFEPPAPPSA
ncbi:MAG: hypothetical protein CMH83_13090 [Nocardioides sp.]|nr:hypothetical protein [Nocardioides sp.]